jgi:hypothetical protein
MRLVQIDVDVNVYVGVAQSNLMRTLLQVYLHRIRPTVVLPVVQASLREDCRTGILAVYIKQIIILLPLIILPLIITFAILKTNYRIRQNAINIKTHEKTIHLPLYTTM